MRCLRLGIGAIVGVLALTNIRAGIPEPDAVVYGWISIAGIRQTANDDVTVFATLGAAADPAVGRYRLGENLAAEDRYVLRIKLESLADGSPPSDDAARIGQTVRVFVQKETSLPVEMGRLQIGDRGTMRNVDLPRSNTDGDADVDLKDFAHFQACFTGANRPPGSAGCRDADFDDDNDIDAADYRYFETLATGPR